MTLEQKYFTMDELVKRGWSLYMTKTLYGEHEETDCQGVHKKIVKYFYSSKICEIEKSREFNQASTKYLRLASQRLLRKLTIQAKDACRYCKTFDMKVRSDGLKQIALYAICKFDDDMMHRTGCRIPDSGRDWHREIPSSKMLSIILKCIKDHGSNYGRARKYIDTIHDKFMSMGVEFREYRSCVSTLNEAFRREVFSKIPEIIEHYESLKAEIVAVSICDRKSCKIDSDMRQ